MPVSPATAELVKLMTKPGAYSMDAYRRWQAPKLARENFPAFMAHMARNRAGEILPPSPVSTMQQYLMEWAYANKKHTAIIAPPSIAKSTNARGFAVYTLGKNPLSRIVFCSQDVNISANNVAPARNIITGYPFRQVFPSVQPDTKANRQAYAREKAEKSGRQEDEKFTRGFTKGEFFLLNSEDDPDPAMCAVAFETTALNRRVDLGIFDDIETDTTTRSQESRANTAAVLDRKWINGRLVDFKSRGVAIVLSNYWHEEDLAHRLRDNADFVSMWIRVSEDLTEFEVTLYNCPADNPVYLNHKAIGLTAISPVEFRCPFPADSLVYNTEALRMKQLSTANFDCIFRGLPRTDKDRMFPSWHAKATCPGTVAEAHGLASPGVGGLPVFSQVERQRYAFAWGYDMAGGKPNGNCLMCWSVDSRGTFRPVEIHYADRLSTGEFISIIESGRERGIFPNTIRPESNAVQTKLCDEIILEAQRRAVPWAHLIEPHETGANKMKPDVGLPSIEVLMKNGQLEWPEKMGALPDVGRFWRLAAAQMQSCPAFPKPNETPEAPMASWFAILGLRQRGFIAANTGQKSFQSLGTPQSYSVF